MLDRVRERAEELLEAVAREHSSLRLSELRPSGVGARYARASDLFSQSRLNEVQLALAAASGAEEKRVRALLEFLVHGRARALAASELDQLLTWTAQASIDVRGRRIGVRAVPAVLRATPDPELRAEVEEAWLAAIDEQTPVLEGLLTRQREVVVELGYGSYLESCEVLSGIDIRGLARDAARFLDGTDGLLQELLAWYLPRHCGVEPEQARAADGLRLERAAPFDPSFLPDLASGAQALLAESGLDPTAGGRLRLERRPALPDGAGATCHALRVPDEVVLTVARPHGRAAHVDFFCSLGLALHRANTSPDLPLEWRWLGDDSVPIGIALTFAGLLESPALLGRLYGLGRERRDDYLRLATLSALLRARREVGQLQFEITLMDEPDSRAAGEVFVHSLERATGLRHDVRAALWSARPAFRTARRLRGIQLQAVLLAHLRDRFDEDWFRNPRAGTALLDLFAGGQSFNAAELSVQLASAPLSFERVHARLEEGLG